MIRALEPVSNGRPRGCLAVLVLVVSLGLPNAAAGAGDKTPIHRKLPTESVQPSFSRSPSSGTTLILLGLLMAGGIMARRVIQRRREGHAERLPEGSIVLLSRQRIDEELTVRVVRVGQRVLVVGSSPQGLATLSEISDPSELAAFTGMEASGDTEARASAPFNGRSAGRPLVTSTQLG